MSIIVYPFKRGLKSTRLLREAGCKVRYATSTVRQGVAIAWGMRTLPPWSDRVRWINDPSSISLVSNKMRWSQLGIGLQATTDKTIAQTWAEERGAKVVCRTILNGHSGEGIIIARNAEQVVDAPLYTYYFRKQREYRIVYGPSVGVVYVASKRLRSDVDLDRDALLIRTINSGFTYQNEFDEIPSVVNDCVVSAGAELSTHGLNLLAYDVAYNSEVDEAVVIEANSAWGMNDYSAALTSAALHKIGEEL